MSRRKLQNSFLIAVTTWAKLEIVLGSILVLFVLGYAVLTIPASEIIPSVSTTAPVTQE